MEIGSLQNEIQGRPEPQRVRNVGQSKRDILLYSSQNARELVLARMWMEGKEPLLTAVLLKTSVASPEIGTEVSSKLQPI